jgi:hypothetical protein
MTNFEEKFLKYLKSLIQFSVVPHKQIEAVLQKSIPFADVAQSEDGNFLYIDMEESYVYSLTWEEKTNNMFWLKDIQIEK